MQYLIFPSTMLTSFDVKKNIIELLFHFIKHFKVNIKSKSFLLKNMPGLTVHDLSVQKCSNSIFL